MASHVNNISSRLSLRTPQRQSLDILHQVMELAKPHKNPDLGDALAAIRSAFKSVEAFDARRKAAEANIPKRIGIGGLDATDLLKIRQIMKEKSCAQRGLS